MRPVGFGEALRAGTRLTLFSDDKLDRILTVRRGRQNSFTHSSKKHVLKSD
jgi:hypothetical protein